MFYLKLAWANIKKNRPTYLPFLGSMIFLIILNLLMQVMIHNGGMKTLPQAATVRSIFDFGQNVISIFSIIFAFYTNSFLIKRRQKELGLYNILGMDKKSLALMLFVESIISTVTTLIIGLLFGTIFSKFLFLVLKRMTGFGEDFIFQLTMPMLLFVAIFFLGLFCLLFIYNIVQLMRTKPIDLLHGSETGEKEPKAHWILSIIGIVCLAAGYTLSLTIESPVEAITTFFFAIILVIVGTYLLMITASITLLKFLRNRKKFYYQPKNFINISGMIYRMKQNGAGLASICILSTMVLVTVSSTAGLFFGKEDMLRTRNPNDIEITTQLPSEDLEEQVLTLADENNIKVDEVYQFQALDIALLSDHEGDFTPIDGSIPDFGKMASMEFLTLADYQKLTGVEESLERDEMLLFEASGILKHEEITLGNQTFKIRKKLDELPFLSQVVNIMDLFVFIVKDDTVLQQLQTEINEKSEEKNVAVIKENLLLNISGTQENRMNYSNALFNLGNDLNAAIANETLPDPDQQYLSIDTIDEDRVINEAFTGGFLFIGLVFGLSFTAATALIIYYKQISEGYEDAGRFEIMQQVGMSRKEVKQTIHSQILMVFLFPIILAITHLAFALPSIKKILILFGLINSNLINLVTVIAIGIFTLCYLAVYWQTSRVYYQLVERKKI